MKDVLFINSVVQNCGIYQFGKRLYEIVKNSDKINYIYAEIDSFDKYIELRDRVDPEFAIMNWYHTIVPWLPYDLNIVSNTKHYFIFHERPVRKYYDKYLFFGDHDISSGFIDSVNTVIPEKCVTLPRPLFKYENKFTKNDIPTIGSFGFMSSWNKGFDVITSMVNSQFDSAILNLHMVWSPFCDADKTMLYQMADKCRSIITKPNIHINITHDLMNNNDMLDFLAKNDLNVFLYKTSPQYGLSSASDYALSVKRPMAVDNSIPFRHIMCDKMDVHKHSMSEIIGYGTEHLDKIYDKHSPEKLIISMDRIFTNE